MRQGQNKQEMKYLGERNGQKNGSSCFILFLTGMMKASVFVTSPF